MNFELIEGIGKIFTISLSNSDGDPINAADYVLTGGAEVNNRARVDMSAQLLDNNRVQMTLPGLYIKPGSGGLGLVWHYQLRVTHRVSGSTWLLLSGKITVRPWCGMTEAAEIAMHPDTVQVSALLDNESVEVVCTIESTESAASAALALTSAESAAASAEAAATSEAAAETSADNASVSAADAQTYSEAAADSASSAADAAALIGDAALKNANNAYTGTNTFNGTAVFNGAVSVGEPTTDTAPLRRGERDLLSFLSELNKGELTPELTLSSETGSVIEAKNGIVCPNDGTIVSAYQKTRLSGIFGTGSYKAWNSIYIPFSLARPYGTAPGGSALAVRLCMGDSVSSYVYDALSSLERPGWDFPAADGLPSHKHWHYAEIFITINESDNGGSIIFRSPMYSSSTNRSITGMTEWRSTLPSGTYPFIPNGGNTRGGKGILIVRTSDYKASVYYVTESATVQYRKIGEMYCSAGSIYNSGTIGSFCVYASGMVPTSADVSATLTIPKIKILLGRYTPAADDLLAASTFTHTVENLTTAELEEKYPIES